MNQINDILDIAKLLAQGEEKCEQKHWQEVSKIRQSQDKAASEYDPTAIVESNFKTKRRIVLSNAIKFVEAFKWRFDKEVIAPISTNELGLQLAIGCEKIKNPRNKIKSIIDNLLTLKVIKLESDVYSSNKSISKLYSFNQLVYSKLLAYANSKYKLSINQNSSLCYHISNGCRDLQTEDASNEVKFDESRIRICKRMKMDVTDVSLSKIESVLNARYPQFLEGKLIADELNKSLPIEEQIKWQWNLELKLKDGKKYLTKIGFRASNIICSYKKRKNDNPCYTGKWRSEYLNSIYGPKCNHYDFNASIWRLSYNLLHDDMLDESTDGYELAYGDKFESTEDREIFKKIAMRIYFGGINQLGVQVENKFKEIATKLGEKYSYDRERAKLIQEIMSDQKLLAVEQIGGFFDSEIFLHESCIYLNIYKDIVDSGIRCTQIYDSFYFNADVNINVNQLYKTHLNQYKLKFANTFKFLTLDDCAIIISNGCRGNGCRRNKAMNKSNKHKFANTFKFLTLDDCAIIISNGCRGNGCRRNKAMNKSNKHKQDNSDIPTDEDMKKEEQERYAKLDKKYKFSSLLAMAEHGDISSKDLNILLEAFKFKYLRAKPCKLGFTPSNTSIAFKKFVNNTISRISAIS